MALKGEFKKDVAGWNNAFNSPKGMTGSYLASQAKGVERLAKTLAPKGSGRLAASIEAGPVTGHALGMEVSVTADVRYALAVHEGTSPHIIHPKQQDGVIVFPSNGMIVYAEEVHHPGTKGQPFLNDALVMVTRHWDHTTGHPKPPA